MFVQSNSIKAVKAYFKSRLADQFSESEIRSIAKQSIQKRLTISNSDYLLADEKLVSESDLLFFRSIVKRLQANEPFQYILGETDFFGLTLKVDARALIPRPETEELVQLIIDSVNKSSLRKVMDLCTGSGCIALGLKSKLLQAEVVGVDVSNEALSLADENSEITGLPCLWVQVDVTQDADLAQFEEASFDCWVSNPPYIPNSEREEMKAHVLEFEPEMALFVEDADPLLFYRKISEKGLKYLKKGGSLYFEIHERYGREITVMLEALGYGSVKVVKDLQGKDRMVTGVKG